MSEKKIDSTALALEAIHAEKLGMEGVKSFATTYPNGNVGNKFALPEVKFDESKAVVKPSDKVAKITEENSEVWKALHGEIMACAGVVSINTSKIGRKIVGAVYQTKDTRFATMALESISTSIPKYLNTFRTYLKVWGLEFSAESGDGRLECSRITDASKYGELCKAIGKAPMDQVVAAYNKSIRDAKDESKEFVLGDATRTAIESIENRFAKKADKLKGNDKKHDAFMNAMAEKDFALNLGILAGALVEQVNAQGIDIRTLVNELKSHMGEAVKASKTAKETA